MHLIDLSEEHLRRMNIGRRYWGATVDAMTGTPRSIAEDYCTNMYKYMSKGTGLFIHGPNGVGKTWMACAILKYAMSCRVSSYCVLSDKLRATYIEKDMFDDGQTVINRVETVALLCLEDLGKEYSGKGSSWSEMCFENLIRLRDRELRPTIITTNLTPEEFESRYKNSAVSLVLGSMIPVHFEGPDLRIEQAAKLRHNV
jgi:DNA replication protein DnaC